MAAKEDQAALTLKLDIHDFEVETPYRSNPRDPPVRLTTRLRNEEAGAVALAAITMPWSKEGKERIMRQLFEVPAVREAAQNALQALTDEEAEQAQAELEEYERQQAIKQGPALTED